MEAQRLLVEDGVELRDRRAALEPLDPTPARGLSAVEKALVERFGAALQGRVLVLGCEVGRFTAQLHRLAHELHGACGAAQDVRRCRRAYPHAVFTVCDPRDLADFAPGAFDAVLVPDDALDALGGGDRRKALRDIRPLLVRDGLLILSSPNREYRARRPSWLRVLLGSPRLPVRSISRDGQERQLSQLGYELLECLDRDGRCVERSASAQHCRRLHYVALA